MSAELAAEKGVILGEPYTPPGRTGSFDVPSYDDIADLNQLFKRFANTAASYSEAGGTVTSVNGSFTVNETQLGTTFMNVSNTVCAATLTKVAVPKPGMRFNVIQLGAGPVQVKGADGTIKVSGVLTTPGLYQGLTVLYLDEIWWCVPFGGSGGGGSSTVPVFNISTDATITSANVGGLLAVDPGGSSKTITVPNDNGSIPIGSVIVVSHVGAGASTKVNVVGDTNVILQDRSNADISRWRSASLIKRAANVWLINAGSSGGSTGSVPTPPVLKTLTSGPDSANATWSKPLDDGGSSVSSYIAEKSTDGGVAWSTVCIFDGSLTAGSVKPLTADVSVQVRLRAVNSSGPSDPSNAMTVMATPSSVPQPIVAYAGAGTWTITNYNPAFLYTGSSTSGACTIIAGTISSTGANSIATVQAQAKAGSPASSVYLQRRAYTYHQECHQECSPGCRAICRNCFNGGPCSGCEGAQVGCSGDGDCGADGCICCGGSSPANCHDVCNSVKDGTPAGFTDGGAEWHRQSNSPLTASDAVTVVDMDMDGMAGYPPVLPPVDPNWIDWRIGQPLVKEFSLPLAGSPSDNAPADLSTNILSFSLHGKVLRYYTWFEDEAFNLHYRDGQGWFFSLNAVSGFDWIPALGCDWEFIAMRADRKTVLSEVSGRLMVHS